jgi:hypothetical protein
MSIFTAIYLLIAILALAICLTIFSLILDFKALKMRKRKEVKKKEKVRA